MCEQGKEDEKVRNLLDAFSFRTEQRPRPRSIRGDKMGTLEEEQRVPGVPEALYSLGTRGIRGLPLAGALSRRHVCFSVVKRAAGRQTGLNQPLPPPPPPSPPSTQPAHLLCFLSRSLSVARAFTLSLSFPLASHLPSLLDNPSLFPCARLSRGTRTAGPRVSPLGNKLLFV